MPNRNCPGKFFLPLHCNFVLASLSCLKQQAEKKHQSCQKDTKAIQAVLADKEHEEDLSSLLAVMASRRQLR